MSENEFLLSLIGMVYIFRRCLFIGDVLFMTFMVYHFDITSSWLILRFYDDIKIQTREKYQGVEFIRFA